MHGPNRPFSYALFRVVPNLDRGEALNVGVLVFCRPLDYLGVRVHLDADRLRSLWPALDSEELRPHLQAIERIAVGDPGAGPIAQLDPTGRFHWLVSPSSTMIQPSEVHTGVCGDPTAELRHLYEELVAPPAPAPKRTRDR